MHSPPRILIVEDQYMSAQDCERQLSAAGFDCVGLASTAADAILLARREQPDLILMDIRLASRTGGIETAREIFESYGIRSIFVSAHGDPQTRQQAESASPLGWLSKPYSSAELLKAVEDGLAQLALDADVATTLRGQIAEH